LDAEVVALIGKRMKMAEELGQVKTENNLAIYQPDRWRDIVESRTRWGMENDLDDDFIFRLFELIHDLSIKKQLAVFNNHISH
jgi:Chorismate mutase